MKVHTTRTEGKVLSLGQSKTLYVPISKHLGHGLKKGDTVTIEMKGGKLMVYKVRGTSDD